MMQRLGPISSDQFSIPVVENCHKILSEKCRNFEAGGRPHAAEKGVIASAFDSLKVLFEPFEDRFHNFICPLPIHVEVDAVF